MRTTAIARYVVKGTENRLAETMIGLYFCGVIILAAAALWFARNKAPSRKAMFERYGVSYFKVLLRQRGLDVSTMSDADLAKIVRAKIQAAKRQATIVDLSETRFLGSNWKITLVKSLEAEANQMVSMALSVDKNGSVSDQQKAPEILKAAGAQPGVLPEGMNLDQFVEAVSKGELYSTLNKRQSKPPKS